MDQPASLDSMLQLTPAPAGRLSVKARPVARPSPLLQSVTVKPICSPALTDGASASFATSISAHRTSVVAEASSEPSLVVLTDAVLSYVPQLSFVVLLTTWTDALAPAARLVGAKARLSLCGLPLIEKPPDWDSMLQSIPAPPGSGSLNATPSAVPAPLLL